LKDLRGNKRMNPLEMEIAQKLKKTIEQKVTVRELPPL
jgi:hypothetical protein